MNNETHVTSYILKAKKFAEPPFQSKKIVEKVRVIFGPFWAFLGHFGHFWAILGHICATLGHFGSFLGHLGSFWVIFGHFLVLILFGNIYICAIQIAFCNSG